jgi:hypothetical protein
MLNYKAVLGAAALAVGAMSGLTSQAGSAEPMFFYFFYSDASKTDMVGFRRDVCTNGYVTSGPVAGYVTAYYDTELIGQCPGYLY